MCFGDRKFDNIWVFFKGVYNLIGEKDMCLNNVKCILK